MLGIEPGQPHTRLCYCSGPLHQVYKHELALFKLESRWFFFGGGGGNLTYLSNDRTYMQMHESKFYLTCCWLEPYCLEILPCFWFVLVVGSFIGGVVFWFGGHSQQGLECWGWRVYFWQCLRDHAKPGIKPGALVCKACAPDLESMPGPCSV